jgi:phosphate transport system substrate-binding protein
MTRSFYILCLLLIAGLSWPVGDLAASQYHWNNSSTFLENRPAAIPIRLSPDGPILIVVNRNNPVTNLTIRQLARIYSGEVTEWPNGDSIIAINRPIESDIRERFYHYVFNARATQKFFQIGSPIPFETVRVDNETSVTRFVARDRGAIAYCLRNCADSSVKVLTIDGKSPEDHEYELK